MAGFRGAKFDLPITRDVDEKGLYWPSLDERSSENVGGNRDYCSLGRVSRSEVRELVEAERAVIDELSKSENWEEFYEEWLDSRIELGFDLGTNAIASALAAARCLPFYSCNGGVFGDSHNDTYPLVAFFCREPIFPFIKAAAEAVDVGLEYNRTGGLTAFSKDVDALINMASALYDRRGEIGATRVIGTATKRSAKGRGGQGELF
ncbi:hypothetical protein LOC51_17865 [Rubrivivax sp. JA1024]|nr:hypothetical protein [Rubrivivax sp. JA1024]